MSDIHERIMLGHYKPSSTFPMMPPRECPNGHSVKSDSFDFCPYCGLPVKKYYEQRKKEAKEKRVKYQEEKDRLLQEFKRDALEYCDIPEDHPKAQKMFDIAWDMGHSSGFHEVLHYMEELSDLLTS